MNDFQDGPDNFNNGSENNSSPQTKKPSTLFEVLLGIAISAIAYALTLLISFRGLPGSIILLLNFILVVALVFLMVRFSRTAHKTTAIIMLVFLSPYIFVLLLMGSCALLV